MKFKSSKRFIISFIFILVILFVSAYSTWSTGWLVVNNGVSVDVLVTAAETCHRVTNSGSYTYFVPTKTTTEWDAFAAHLPSGVGVGSCCECSSGDDCCSDGCNYDADGTSCGTCNWCQTGDCKHCRWVSDWVSPPHYVPTGVAVYCDINKAGSAAYYFAGPSGELSCDTGLAPSIGYNVNYPGQSSGWICTCD